MIALPRTDRTLVGSWWWTVDRVLLASIAALLLVGTILVFAASPPVSERIYGDGTRFIVKHIVFLGPALTLLFGVSLLAPRGVLRLGVLMLGLFTLLLVLTLFLGLEVKGARRWLIVAGTQIQPSEFVKPALAVVAAYLLSRRDGLQGAPEAVALVGLVLFVVVQQPDLGMAAVIGFVAGLQLFVAGLAWPWLAGLAGLAALGAVQAYLVWPHFQQRVDAFLDPHSVGYQVEQALRAVTAGGMLGRGPGEGRTKFLLPDAHADFIFAATAEEFGVLACLLLLLLFAFVVLRGLWGVHRAADRFTQLAAVGLIGQIGIQAVINMAVNLNLVPTKGMTLPFVSYGGSSLLALAIAAGMLLALTRRNARLEIDR